MNIFWFLLVGLIAGWLAEMLTRRRDPGFIVTIIYGVVGASIGGFVFNYLGIATGSGFGSQVLVATAGAVILIVVLRLIRSTDANNRS
jgi:uncharacterized membrane protein YeaQ/YmgE (transglycosylase-associated protein family)